MKRMSVPVENMAEIIWGALLVGYLAFSKNPLFLRPNVLVVFILSGVAAFVELYLRKINWRFLLAYDTVVWTILLTGMVAVTGGRGSELWPAFLLMSLTAPAVDSRSYPYGLLAVNSILYGLIYLLWNPLATPFEPSLLGMRIGLFFLVTWVVDRSMIRERRANQVAVAAIEGRVTELTEARDNERRRIAADIHDWLGTGIVAPIRQLELAQRAPSPEAAQIRIQEAIQILTRSHSELRRVMEDLHPHLLEQLGLADGLRAYLTQWGAEHQVQTHFGVTTGPEPANQLGVTLFRILQESLNNCAKHAGAESVQVALHLGPDRIDLTIQDDGHGFDLAQAGLTGNDRPVGSGRGLTGMRERAAVYGGTFQVDSQPAQGTIIRVRLPHQPT